MFAPWLLHFNRVKIVFFPFFGYPLDRTAYWVYHMNKSSYERMLDMAEEWPPAACPGSTDLVEKLQNELPDDEVLYDLAELFRVFGDSTRIKILYALFESELCVGDIAQVLGMTQSSVSHQLRLLKSSKLVKFRREGKAVFYSLDDDHVRSMIALGLEHVEE